MNLKLKKLPEAESREAIRQIQVKGDFTLAAEVIKNPDVVLTPELRELIAAKLTDKYRAKRGPKEDIKTRVKAVEANKCIWWLTQVEGWEKKDAAKKHVEEMFNVSLRTVNSWQRLVNDPEFVNDPRFSHIVKSAKDLESWVLTFKSGGISGPEKLSFLKPTILRWHEESMPIENYIEVLVRVIEEKKLPPLSFA